MNKFIAAAIQLDSMADKRANLNMAIDFITEAASRGAKLIAMPEQMNYIGPRIGEQVERIPQGETFLAMAELAKEYKVWIHCGSIFEDIGEDRPSNTTMVINPKGELSAKYQKIHAFDVDIKDGPSIRESDRILPGKDVVTLDTKEVGHLGLSICYDMRFAEIYRVMALRGAEIFLVPSNFTLNTGKDHWEPLLRARAIENSCYVIAPAQCGIKPKFAAYGRSLIVDPWGNVIAQASDKPGVITAEIDLDYQKSVRQQVLTLENRRPDVYTLHTNS